MYNKENQIKAIIFDMDGLLIDSEPFWQETERTIFKQHGIDITEEMQHATFGLRTDEQIHYWYKFKPWPDADLKAIEEKYNEKIKDFFIEKGKLIEGVDYILNFFKERKYNVALASSSTMDLIQTFLDKFKLRSYFSAIHSAENEEYGKPHPAVYLHTAKLLNLHPSLCLAFEDSLVGVIAAKAAKMKVVAVPDKRHYNLPGYSIANLKIASLSLFGESELEQIIKL